MRRALNFVTQAHERDSCTIITSASSIERLYPNSTFYIYNGGLTKQSREKLASFKNTQLIDWQNEADFSSKYGRILDIISRNERRIKNNTELNHIVKNIFGYGYRYYTIRWNFFTRQKPRVILDLASEVEGDIIWIDSDVVLINKIDEIFNDDFDIAGTVRSVFDERYNDITKLNSGVIVFKTCSETIRIFVQKWLNIIDQLELAEHREQEALTKLFRRSNPNIFEEYYNTGQLHLDSKSAGTKILPCHKYNNFVFTAGIDSEKTKILHFKAGMSNPDIDVNQELLSDIRNGCIDDWWR